MKDVEIVIDGVHHKLVSDDGLLIFCSRCSLMKLCCDTDLCSYFDPLRFDAHFEIVK